MNNYLEEKDGLLVNDNLHIYFFFVANKYINLILSYIPYQIGKKLFHFYQKDDKYMYYYSNLIKKLLIFSIKIILLI